MSLCNSSKYLSIDAYNPSNLLDVVIFNMKIKNDAGLSRLLKVNPPIISKIRNKKIAMSDSVILRIHDVTGMQISEIRNLMGIVK